MATTSTAITTTNTKPGNVKTLIEKYNEINENITRSISPRGLTTSISNHSGSFLISNHSGGNSFYLNGNGNSLSTFSNSSCSNSSSNDGANSSLSPSMLSNLENGNSNNNNNINGCCISSSDNHQNGYMADDCISNSSSTSSNNINENGINNNKNSRWRKISLKLNTDLITSSAISPVSSLSSSTNTSDDDEQSNSSSKFSLSPRPIIKKPEPQSPEILPPPNLDKRRYSRDLIPFTITNI